MTDTKIAIFKGKQIRKTIYKKRSVRRSRTTEIRNRRKKLEKRLGRSLVSKQNYLPKKQNPNQLQWGPPT